MNESRETVLLKATYDLLKKCNDSPYVLNALSQEIFYDDVMCDGMCLANEIAILLDLEELE